MAERICERLADGESLRSICLGEKMPSKTTVFRWLRQFDSFRDQYLRQHGLEVHGPHHRVGSSQG
ncbi:hypothetical protein [Diaphorobacter sp.]|uniref:terminase small subunit-like protein n=1 Tax=Diaphorobacter sp. TaxID=1934310 RepID=UPI0039180C1E